MSTAIDEMFFFILNFTYFHANLEKRLQSDARCVAKFNQYLNLSNALQISKLLKFSLLSRSNGMLDRAATIGQLALLANVNPRIADSNTAVYF